MAGKKRSTMSSSSEPAPPAPPQPPAHSYTTGTNATQRALYDALKSTPRIADLDEPRNVVTFSEAPLTEALYPIVDKHDVLIVAGAFFGDEGKGKTVDALARHPACTCVARTNSGENAGHTVFDAQGRKYVFHLAPSGLLLDNKKNFVGPESVMDPVSFMQKEVGQLIKNGVEYKTKLFLGNVHIVAPYHKLLDMILSPPNSSTLKGMSPVHASKVTKRGIRLDHIFNDEATLRRRLAKDLETYEATLLRKKMSPADVVAQAKGYNADGVPRIPQYVMDFAEAEDKVSYLVDLYYREVRDNEAFPSRADVPHELRAALDRGEKVLLEGPQSYWLSNAREKFWESATSADTAAGGLVATAQFNFQKYRSVVINVHKAPASSRVGIGANPSGYVPQDWFSAQGLQTLRDLPQGMCVDFDAVQRRFVEAVKPNGIIEPIEFTDPTGTYNIGVAMAVSSSLHHGECGATTLKPRICGMFDCVAHFEVNAVQGPYLSISAVDRGDDYDAIGVTIAYVYYNPAGGSTSCNGRVYQNGLVIKSGDPYPGEAALAYCHPIVKLIPGWRDQPIAANKRPARGTPLPRGVCEFISTIEHFTKAQVLSIGNGPSGDNIIYLKRA